MYTLSFSASIDRFLDSLVINGASENTIRAYRADLAGLLTFAAKDATFDATICDKDAVEVLSAKWLTEGRGGWKPKTTERKLGTCRAFARHMGWSPFLAAYRPPKPGRPEPHPIPEGIAGVMAMYHACLTPGGAVTARIRRRRALVALTGLCGLRVGEALSIRPENIDRVDQSLRFLGKGDRERSVPISDLAWPIIRDALRVTPPGQTVVGMKDRGARQLLTKLAERAALSRRVSSHDLRATLATAAYQKSKDIRAVQEILGHSSPTQTQVYTGVDRAAMRVALDVA